MALPTLRHHRRLDLMTAYQFAFYTIYQSFEYKALDKASAWKANAVISVLEGMLALAIFTEVGILFHFRITYDSSTPLLVISSALVLAVFNYYAFDRHDRWKRYAEEFKRYPRTDLIVGRSLVLFGVVLVVGSYFLALYHARMVHLWN